MTGRAGRPQGRARGTTEQANALAEFLLTLTDGMTVRDLAGRYPASKTMWGQYRSGQKIIPLDLLTRLVEDHTSDERTRQVRLASAVRLHAAALEAAPEPPAARAAMPAAEAPPQVKPDAPEPSGTAQAATGAEAGAASAGRRRRTRLLLLAGGGAVLVVLALLVPLAGRGPASAPSPYDTAAESASAERVFAIGPGGQGIFQWDGTDATGWTKIGEGAAHLWSGPAGLFADGPEHRLRRYEGSPGLWSDIGEAGHDVAVSGSGVYRLDTDRKAVRVWDGHGTSWTRIGGPAARLYGGEPGLFATDPNDGRIFRYLGRPDHWEFVGTAGASFALTSSDLYGLNPERTAVNRWLPGQQPAPVLPWVHAAGPAGELYGGAAGLYSTDPSGARLRVLSAGQGDEAAAQIWRDIGAAGAEVRVGRREVYVLTADRSEIVQWSRDTSTWRRIGGPAQTFTAAVCPPAVTEGGACS